MKNAAATILGIIVTAGPALTGCAGTAPPAPTSLVTAPPSPRTAPIIATPMSPTVAVSASTAPAKEKATPESSAPTIGPKKYGKLSLKMTYEEVRAAGIIRDGEPPESGCQGYEMYIGGRQDGIVMISRERGVEAIVPAHNARTVNGVQTGWTVARVRTVYPDLRMVLAHDIVPVPGNREARYRLGFSGTDQDSVLETITLYQVDQACFE